VVEKLQLSGETQREADAQDKSIWLVKHLIVVEEASGPPEKKSFIQVIAIERPKKTHETQYAAKMPIRATNGTEISKTTRYPMATKLSSPRRMYEIPMREITKK